MIDPLGYVPLPAPLGEPLPATLIRPTVASPPLKRPIRQWERLITEGGDYFVDAGGDYLTPDA